MSPAELVLFERWTRQGDAKAFSELVAQHSGMVYATCVRILRNREDAEEVAQECFVKLADSHTNIRSSLAGWLHRVATTRSIDRLRSEKRRIRRDTAYVNEGPTTGEVVWQDIQEYVDEAIAALPDKYQGAVVGHFLEGESYDTLGERLSVPRSTGAYRVRRGVEIVRQNLRKRGVDITAISLAGALAALPAEAAPPSLLAALGKSAIAGAGKGSLGVTAASSCGLLWKAVAIGTSMIALVLLISLAFHPSRTLEAPSERPREAVASEATLPPAVAADIAASPPTSSISDTSGGKPVNVAPQPEATTAHISGNVIDDCGAPFPDARVTLRISSDTNEHRQIAEYETVTNSDGSFAFDCEPGIGVVFADAPGYLMQWGLGAYLAPGGRHERIDLTLIPAAYSVTGLVFDQAGRAVPDADVRLLHFNRALTESENAYGCGLTRFARTDAQGRFTLCLEESGDVTLVISAQGYAQDLFPGVPVTYVEQCFTILKESTQEPRFTLSRGGSVAGRVTLADGTPVAKGDIEAYGISPTPSADPSMVRAMLLPLLSTTTAADGSYRLDGLSECASYIVALVDTTERIATGDKKDFLLKPWAMPLQHVLATKSGITVHRDSITTMDLVQFTPATVRGTITDRTSKAPAENVTVCVSMGIAGPGASRAPQYEWQHTERAITDAEGNYCVPFAPPGAAPVTVQLFYGSQAHVSEANDAKAVRTFILTPGEEKELNFEVDAPVTAPVRLLDGDGTPVAGVRLVLVFEGPEGPVTNSGISAITKADGRFVWRGLEPGRTYRVYTQDVFRDPRGGGLFSALTFTGKPGEVLPEMIMPYKPAGGIAATIMCIEGYALWDKQVVIEGYCPETGDLVLAISRTDENGHFTRMLGLPEGLYPSLALHLRRGGVHHSAIVENVAIVRNEVTDLGVIMVIEDSAPFPEGF
jgi:RNA polymerase sigma-70 factor (ECF subfamily)